MPTQAVTILPEPSNEVLYTLISNKQSINVNNNMRKHAHAVIIVPTIRSKPKTELDPRDLTIDDLKKLKQTDPFMYRSIPAVHTAKLLFKDVDHSSLASSSASSPSAQTYSNASSYLSSAQTLSSASSTQLSRASSVITEHSRSSSVVSRKSILTTECHHDVLLEEELLNDSDNDNDHMSSLDEAVLLNYDDHERMTLSSRDFEMPSDMNDLFGDFSLYMTSNRVDLIGGSLGKRKRC